MAGFALLSSGAGFHSEMAWHKWSGQKLGQFRDAGNGEGVLELEGGNGVQAHNSFRLGKES